jgi:hypothetical protein
MPDWSKMDGWDKTKEVLQMVLLVLGVVAAMFGVWELVAPAIPALLIKLGLFS